jgi:hypothetical protein
LFLSLKVSNTNLSGNIQLRSSIDNYAAPIQTFNGIITSGDIYTFQVPLSTTTTTEGTFRLYAWGQLPNTTLDVTDFNFDGVVVVDPNAPSVLGTTALSTLIFTGLDYNVESTEQKVKIYGLNPNPGYDAIVSIVSNSTDIEVSNDNNTWGPNTTITLQSAALHDLYIRMKPDFYGTQIRNISVNSTFFPNGPLTINVQGTVVVDPPFALAADPITSNSFVANSWC